MSLNAVDWSGRSSLSCCDHQQRSKAPAYAYKRDTFLGSAAQMPAQAADFQNLTGASGSNSQGGSGSLPSVTYAQAATQPSGSQYNQTNDVTDALGRTWRYTKQYGGGSYEAVRRPGSSGDNVRVNMTDAGVVTSVVRDGATWTYNYQPSGNTATLTVWYYKARMYSPTLGRFLQTDPIGYGDGLNWYNYLGGDPVNRIDPTGLAYQLVPSQICKRVMVRVEEEGSAPSTGINCTSGYQLIYVPDPHVGAGIAPPPAPGAGAPAPTPTTPQNNQPAKPKPTAAQCLAQVAKKDGAGTLLDALSLIPGGGEGADIARVLGSVASAQMSSSVTGAVVGRAGTASAVANSAYRLNPTLGIKGAAKDTFQAIPVIGTFVGAGASLYDGYSAYQDYVNCMTGKAI